MKFLIFIIAVFCCVSPLISQTPRSDAALRTFTTNDLHHLKQEHELLFKQHASQAFLFDTLLPLTAAAYEKKPGNILRIHLLRLQANAASNYKNLNYEIGIRPESITFMEEAIRLCYLEKNDLLLAETYFDMAELYNLYRRYEEYITMLSRAFDITTRIGQESFPPLLLYFKLAGMCKAAYHIHNYQESLNYGNKALAIRNKLDQSPGDESDIFLLDLVGFCHKLLHNADSSIYYYQRLQGALAKMDTSWQYYRLWSAIANGNIGENLSAKGSYAAAAPMLEQWLAAGIAFRDSANICLASHALAANYFRQENTGKAIGYWKEVYGWSMHNQQYQYTNAAADGMAAIYRLQQKHDSAYYYYRQAASFRDSLTVFNNRSGLQAIQSKVKLDNLQYSLQTSTALLKEEKRSKQFLLASIVLLAVIAALLYNRQRMKTASRLQRMAQAKREAELESLKAKEEIGNFVKHIKEKNDLIDSLRDKLSADEMLKARQDIHESLAEYTLITDKEWEQFRTDFSKTYTSFFPAMAARLHQVTPAEERLATLIFLGFNNLQIANTLGISRESVTRAKYRLKQRLGLSKNDELEVLIASW